MDLFGLVHIESRAGKRYSLVIIDEFSRFTWVMSIHNKKNDANEVISLIKQLKVLYNRKVK